MDDTAVTALLRHAADRPDHPALVADGRALGYAALADAARRWAGAFRAVGPGPVVGVVGHRTSEALAAVAGVAVAGGTLVALRPDDPPERLAQLCARAGVQVLAADRTAAHLPALRARLGDAVPLAVPGAPVAPSTDPSPVAVLPFTSGSTGGPRPVEVTRAGLGAFLDAARERWPLSPDDRVSQWFELGFDLHLFDLWVAWTAGACVVVPSAADALAPVAFARRAGLTTWFSVPSLARLARRTGALTPGALPALRRSLFCGEALPEGLAAAWAAAAPHAPIDNLYGPTECTVACTAHRFVPGDADARAGLVPIGSPLASVEARVEDDGGRPVPDGVPGELVVVGALVARGYRGDADRTALRFTTRGGRPAYRTGDRVVRPRPGGPLCWLGRADDQLKVRGHRIEPGEVEGALRAVPGVVDAVVVPVRPDGEGVDALAAWVVGDVSPADVRRAAAAVLPPAAVPRAVHVVAALPVTPRGKVDRAALASEPG